MIRRILWTAVIVVATTVGGMVAAVWVDVHRAPAGNAGSVVRLTIPRGQPFVVIAARLKENGLVRHVRPLQVYAAYTGADRRVQSGTFDFVVGANGVEILHKLVRGDVVRVSVTIPEGFTKWEIAGAFTVAGVDSQLMLAAIEDPAILQTRRIPTPSLEGYLFPDTYHVGWSASARDVVGQMLSRLDAAVGAGDLERAAEIGMTPHEVLTMASIIEAETRVPSERPIVSAVYHNRLRRGMKLEADPTVAYAMGGYRGRLLYADLETDSPYNTYRNRGLPPGPICSPGAASIHAALHPDSTSRALYFVARGDGSHIFSMTLAEHNAAIREFRRRRAATPEKREPVAASGENP